MFIVNPFRGESILELFSTHPSTEKRIRRLEEMASSGRF
jgi:heat shock protein HtpX